MKEYSNELISIYNQYLPYLDNSNIVVNDSKVVRHYDLKPNLKKRKAAKAAKQSRKRNRK